MAFWVRVLCFAAALFCVPVAALAQDESIPAPENPVSEVCDAFPSQMGDRDLAWLRYQFVNRAPARYAPVLSKVVFVLGEETSNLGPVFVPGEPSRIEVGPAFLRDLCLATVLQDLAMRLSAEKLRSFRDDFARCIGRAEDALPCFRRSVRSLGEAAPPPWTDVARKAETVQLFHLTTLSTARYLLAHEAAHAIFREPGTDRLKAIDDEEYEADIFAYVGTLTDGTLPIGPLFVFATQSVIDERISGQLAPTHGASICRYQRSKIIFERLFAPAMQAQLLADQIGSPSNAGGGLINDQVRVPNFLLGSGAERCQANFDAKLADLEHDLSAIEALTSQVAGSPPDAALMQRVASGLAGQNYRTAGGSRVGISLAMALAARRTGKLDLLAQVKARGDITKDEAAGFANVLIEAMEQLHGDPRDYLGPSELSFILSVRAVASLVSRPPGTPLVAATRSALEDLEAAARLSDPLAELEARAYLLALLPAVAQTYKETVGQIETIQTVRIMVGVAASGDCGASQRIFLGTQKAISGVDTPASPISPEQCTAMRKEIIATFVKTFGWTYDEAEAAQ